MFAQFIEGVASDSEALHRQLDRWMEECGPGAIGWLGMTAGVTADGTGFVAARFESADAARANSGRPEQSAWWAETEGLFQGPVSFMDCDGAELFREGGADDAGFVQVIRGRVNDVEAARELFLEAMPDDVRPEIIGGVVGMLADGQYTSVVYFTSEAEARVGEAEEPSDEFVERMAVLHDSPPRYLDLTEPWLYSP